VGEQGTWNCVVANVSQGEETLHIHKVESQRDDFDIEGLALPLELAPGERDTLRVVFAPEAENERVGIIQLYVKQSDSTNHIIRLRLRGNRPGVTDSASVVLSREMVLGTTRVALSDTMHFFGTYKPGYLAILKSYNRNLQKRIDTSFPILGGIDIAEYINTRLHTVSTSLLPEISDLAGKLISGVTFVIVVPLVLFFFLSEGRAIKRALIELVPNRYFEMVLNLLYRIDVQLGGYIRGMVLYVIIMSILSILGLYAVGLEYFLVIGAVAGIVNVIPYLGPMIGIVAGVMAAVIQHSALTVGVMLPVVVVLLVVHLIDNVFVTPVVVARSVNLHPLIVIFMVLVGSQLFGAIGMLLAVPVTAVLKVTIQTIVEGLRSYSV
jgi:predicted PurR-regulated permease PerM